uniref:Uncharacterized protein n=1 Tax=Vibrio splendidus TaxID=29497 RepID=A0A0H3ZUD7_VIBSP|nr:hypothetical protein [Vibrio splendidus]
MALLCCSELLNETSSCKSKTLRIPSLLLFSSVFPLAS